MNDDDGELPCEVCGVEHAGRRCAPNYKRNADDERADDYDRSRDEGD